MKPLIGLAPMDGITDVAFRQIVDEIGRPDLLFTEFVPVEAIAHGAMRVAPALYRHETKTKTIAQFFGRDLKSFYKSTIIAAALGFDGVDINMGCPDKNIAKKGGGAGLIGQPDLAVEIVRVVKQAIKDWSDGITYERAQIPISMIEFIRNKQSRVVRTIIPVSVKTRLGLDKPITKEWISRLITSSPDMISLHGRTLLQLYRGQADWNEIAIAADLVKKANITFLGNGDIKTIQQAKEYSKKYGCDGVLIGRASLGNPWVFSQTNPSLNERVEFMLKHAQLFMKYRPELKLYPMRKHLAWYTAGFTGSRKLRNSLMQIVSYQELEELLTPLKT